MSVGTHCILELFNCPVTKLDDPSFVTSALREAAKIAQSTLLKEVSHRFEPQGVTAIGLLAESHISIHTWPENAYAAADLFTCSERAEPEEACKFLAQVFQAKRYTLRVLPRGNGCEIERATEDDPAAKRPAVGVR